MGIPRRRSSTQSSRLSSMASESSPARFEIINAAPDATCTAVENDVPAGYVADIRRCQNGDPLDGICSIINTKVEGTVDDFTVYKDYSDNNSDSVSVSLSCSSGTVTSSPLWAREGAPAVFTIEGASANATCTATETSVAVGYTKDESDCQGRSLNGSCTIVNTKDAPVVDEFTVYKDYSDDNSDSVSVSLSCSSGAVTNSPQWAREGSPAVFTIEGASANATCTATETSVAVGYTKDESDCQDGDSINGSCTIYNNKVNSPPTALFEWDFEDGSSSGWSPNGDVALDGILAIDQYSLRHGKGSTSEMNVSTVGYREVSVKMHLAASSLKKQDQCLAQVSVNSGASWTTVVDVTGKEPDAQFNAGTVTISGASDNPDLRLRFTYPGRGKGGYCYGDDIVISGVAE